MYGEVFFSTVGYLFQVCEKCHFSREKSDGSLSKRRVAQPAAAPLSLSLNASHDGLFAVVAVADLHVTPFGRALINFAVIAT